MHCVCRALTSSTAVCLVLSNKVRGLPNVQIKDWGVQTFYIIRSPDLIQRGHLRNSEPVKACSVDVPTYGVSVIVLLMDSLPCNTMIRLFDYNRTLFWRGRVGVY